MTIKQRVILGIAVSVMLFIGLGLIFFVTGREVSAEMAKARLSARIGRLVSDLHILTTDYLVRPSPLLRDQWQKKYDALAPLLADESFDSKGGQSTLGRIHSAYEGVGANFIKLTAVADSEAADFSAEDAALRRRLVGQLLVMNHAMMSGAFQLDEQSRQQIESGQRRAEVVAFTFIVVSTLITVIVGIATMAGTVRGLKRMTDVASAVTGGDLTVDLAVHGRHDEIGTLMKAFRTMTHSLRRQTSQVREATDIIGSSVSDISSSIAQVTTSATETAAALSETSATVEELKQTADINSRKASDVAGLAERAAHASQSGKAATLRIADEVGHIHGQMEAIGDSLTRLSEQSQNIGEIIGAVDDISEQSNLLAVNAAIEAAHAGEHGKGFTVVAEEIKNLAEQSREATRRVRTILGDIQKQTAAAVMASEEGGKAVAAAVSQEADARSAIETLSDSIERAAESATQIAVSSHEQMVGVDQVGTAMENIRGAANQNASGMHQLEQASRRLQELGQKLVDLMKRYKV